MFQGGLFILAQRQFLSEIGNDVGYIPENLG